MKIVKIKNINKIDKLKKTLINLFFISILCLVLFIIYSKFFLRNINIKPFGIQILIVSSNSMKPEFQKNDIIIIKEEKEYNIGDIVTFIDKEGNLVTHRIIEKYENAFYTKGDNNNTKDEPKISYSEISGKVIFTIKLRD